MNQSDNKSGFLEEMQDVKKIEQDKVLSAPTNTENQSSLNYRRNAAEKLIAKYENFLTDGDVEPVEPQEVLSYKISGIQPNVFKNLKKAKYGFDYQIDLHRTSVNQARKVIFRLIMSADKEDFRCILITHGKGENNPQPAKLKSYVNHWLRQFEQVVAFHSALPKHGGSGAVYVLLKKPKEIDRPNEAKYQ